MSHIEFEEYAVQKTDELQEYIDKGVAPPECKNVGWMVYEGDKFKLICTYYCDYSESCPYFNSHSGAAKKTKFTVQGW